MTMKFLEAEQRLEISLATWIERHRADGMGWVWMAIEIARLTGVQVSAQELEDWATR